MQRRTKHLLAAVLTLGVAGIAAGCREEPDAAAPASSAGATPAAAPAAPRGTGTIRGTVSLVGQPPAMKVLANKPCHPGATPIREETVVASADGRLATVVVFLREAPAGAPDEALPPAELDQANCRFVPHVLALKTGQVLRVKTSDPTLHNVHTLSSINPAKNLAFVENAAPKDLSFAEPEEFTVRCDVHHWMNARIHVFNHRHFAVSGTDGAFELADVPAGQHTLVFRHELFGDLERTVDVADGTIAEVSIAYARPER